MEEEGRAGEEVGPTRGNLLFAVNGERFEVSSCDPSTTLLEFLRTRTRFKSPKLGCGQGGCGACVVLLSKYDSEHDQVEDFTISSCLTLLCSVNQCSITTSEGLGNSKDGFHPIHKRFSGFHASQCGFCTPGMCMSLFGALVKASKTNRQEPLEGFSKLTVVEAEKSISGNLCRCTGYRPIVDACKSFATDVDIEDLGFNSFWRKEDTAEKKISNIPSYDSKTKVLTFPEFLKEETRSSWFFSSGTCSWARPVTLRELNSISNSDAKVRLVAGNTGTGYYKELDHFDKYVDLRYVPELSVIGKAREGLTIGASVTISNAIKALKEDIFEECSSESAMMLRKVALHMEKIGTEFMRNLGTVGGNLMLAQQKHFPSDISTVLLGAGSYVVVVTGGIHRKLTMEEFLELPPLDSRSILLNVEIPVQKTNKFSSESDNKFLFETYRAAPRPAGNALPYLNAAFSAEVTGQNSSGGIVLTKSQLAFGSYGAEHAIRAKKVEEFLCGKTLTFGLLYEALDILKTIIVPDDGNSSPIYRKSLAVGFLFDFLHPLIESASNPFSRLNGCLSVSSDDAYKLPEHRVALLSPSKHVVHVNKEYYPVGEPIIKSGATLQASGEAIFVDDIPSPTNCLYGSFIYSTKPLARVKSVGFQSTSPPKGVYTVISFKDIPEGGQNVGSKTIFGTEPLFADDLTRFAGERVALVIADSQRNADLASDLAVVEYDQEGLEQPILSVEEAVKRSSLFEVPPFVCPKQIGDISKGMAEADQKILSAEMKLGSQYYFYMENQCAMAVPDEDNCIVVYSSTQCPEYMHTIIAKCLGIPEHNVRVITRRVGGGFGGKAIKAMPVAAACALAAQKLGRPVRMYLNRKTDMIMAGGRHPMKITYDVGYKSTGKITALQLEILVNAGISADISPMMPFNILKVLREYDWGALAFDIKVCKTNHSSKSAMRAPGEVQASFIAETVLEHVASALSMDIDYVRTINLHSYDSLRFFYDISSGEPVDYTLVSLWDKLAISSSLERRMEMTREFNGCNTWIKRGISRVPVVHEVNVRPTPGKVSIFSDGSVAVEVGGIELGQGLWTKAKQMAAFALSSVNCDGDLLQKVRVIQTDTLSLIQGGFTAGSTTSESSCEAVRLCCKTLVERLTPLKERLQAKTGAVKWEMLIAQAYLEAVNLSASCYFVPEYASMKYLNYGAAVSEVEINLLTGQTTILRSDIVYDCGQSLNPAVDLGQIEGAFVQGIGFYMLEEYTTNADGLVVANGIWDYKIPTIDTIPKEFNVEILNSGHHKDRVLSSKASGEPPLLLAASVHCAARSAIREAQQQLASWGCSDAVRSMSFHLEVPATMPVVKEHCGLDIVERYLEQRIQGKWDMLPGTVS